MSYKRILAILSLMACLTACGNIPAETTDNVTSAPTASGGSYSDKDGNQITFSGTVGQGYESTIAEESSVAAADTMQFVKESEADTAAKSNETSISAESSEFANENTIIDKTEDQSETVNVVPQCRPSMGFSFELPDGWNYEGVQTDDIPTSFTSVYIRPADTAYENGWISIEYLSSGEFGLCGTGLEMKNIDFNGYSAEQGFYNGSDVWSFILLDDDYFGCAITNNTELYDDYKDTIDEMLSTVRFIKYADDEVCANIKAAQVNTEDYFELTDDETSYIMNAVNNMVWDTEGTSDCLNDCAFIIDGNTVYYHSDCGTFNDNVRNSSYKVSDEQREHINEILVKYITLGFRDLN